MHVAPHGLVVLLKSFAAFLQAVELADRYSDGVGVVLDDFLAAPSAPLRGFDSSCHSNHGSIMW